MSKALQYRSGSVVYFQGDAADKIFILQSGLLNLTYQDIETGKDVHDPVQPGEFFGVKSALGKYPREENAMVISQSATIMVLTVQEFESLAMANTRIIMKMLRVFSNQLRRIHRQVTSLMEKEEQQNPEQGLFNVGEYYLKNHRFLQAKYIFSRYLTYYPSGANAPGAAKNLEIAEIALRKGEGAKAATAPQPKPEEISDTAKAYYDAVSFISQQKYQQAYLTFKKIIDAKQDPQYVAKSIYEIGRCLFMLGKYDDCISHFSGMIVSYPKHPDLGEALFFIGQSYEMLGKKDKAATFYRKLLSMIPDEDDVVNIKTKKALQALGV
jgi:CRP-like cAMP-binding protein